MELQYLYVMLDIFSRYVVGWMVAHRESAALAELGVTNTHSRPHVSDDNPCSESQFTPLKYQPEFPDRFGSIEHVRTFCQWFFTWYNTAHHHTALTLLTLEVVDYHRAPGVLQARQQVLLGASKAPPERFVRRPPQPPVLPEAV